MANAPKNEQSGKNAASASKTLTGKGNDKDSTSAAASALTQAPYKKKK
ncbi:hypothetical protein [Phyllobacterium ifriqiyense]